MTTLYWLAYLTVYVCCLLEQGANYLDFSKTTVSVNGGVYTSLVDNLGNFSVQVPGPGSYKVEVHNLHYHFEPVVVEIYEEEFSPGKDTKAFLFSMKHGKDFRLVYPLVLDPSGRFGYFEIKAPFDPWAYLKNPFVIMIGVTLLMSQMMKNVDQEELKKQQESQADMMKDMPQCA